MLFGLITLGCFAQPQIDGGSASSLTEPDAVVTRGPESGHLVIAGGGWLGDDILLKFIELAGGPEAAIVLYPNSGRW